MRGRWWKWLRGLCQSAQPMKSPSRSFFRQRIGNPILSQTQGVPRARPSPNFGQQEIYDLVANRLVDTIRSHENALKFEKRPHGLTNWPG
mmetsp:Transcript_24020/g.71676  ORF Transcript_24020/g.71676 Transcript_24020/m.71676 type:complete len:90 (+) Transcript_24020:134-403(+)